MKTLISFSSDRFQPTEGELDESHEDYINPGLYGKELSDYLAAHLASRGFPVGFQCPEDWGYYAEVDTGGRFRLSFGCTGEDGDHMIQVHPDKPQIRKLFRKIDVREDVEGLVAAICDILKEDAGITDIVLESSA